MYEFNFGIVADNAPYLIAGLEITLWVTFASLILGGILGVAIGIMRISGIFWVNAIAWGYVELMRNTPVLVQLIWVYYCVPILFGIDFGVVTSCIIALSLQAASFMAEIVRGGIRGIDRGQVEAARTIGLSRAQTMRFVVLPQAMRRMIAPMVNETVSLVKNSSLVSMLGVADLTYQAQVLATTTFRPIEIFTALAAEYLVICGLLSFAASRLEKYLSKSD